MALFRNRADLILATVRNENPQLPVQLSVGNCFVYRYGSFSKSKGFCTVKGRYGSGVREKAVFRYNKLDVATLLKNVTAKVNFSGASTTKDILPALNSRYGFDLTEAEIVDHPLELNGTQARLELANVSPLYKGLVLVLVEPALPVLSALVGVRELVPELQYWPVQSGFNGSFVSIGHDYTAIMGPLSGIAEGTLSESTAASLAFSLSSVDQNPWVGHGPAEYSLKEAEVIYNGPSSYLPAEYAPLLRAVFNRTLIIEPNATQNTNMGSAPIAFHYNVF